MAPLFQKVIQNAVFPKQTFNSASILQPRSSKLPNIYAPNSGDSHSQQTASMFLPKTSNLKPQGAKINLPLKNKAKFVLPGETNMLFNSLGIKTRLKNVVTGDIVVNDNTDLVQTCTRTNYALPSISMFMKKT